MEIVGELFAYWTDKDVQISQAISLKRIADAIEKQTELMLKQSASLYNIELEDK